MNYSHNFVENNNLDKFYEEVCLNYGRVSQG